MRIEIIHDVNGHWLVTFGLIEKRFLSVEMAIEYVNTMMLEAEESFMRSIQDTSGT